MTRERYHRTYGDNCRLELTWVQAGCCIAQVEAKYDGKTIWKGEFRMSGDIENTAEIYVGEAEKKARSCMT